MLEFASAGSAETGIGHHIAIDRCVYIIDDDSDLRKSLKFLLSATGITAWPFAAAEDFFDHLPGLMPGPILLDIRMAGLDGLQTLHLLRDHQIGWPVIIMSAHGDIAIAVKAMKLGAIEFLEKPFMAEMLDTALSQAFDNLRASEQSQCAATQARQRLSTLSPRESEVIHCLVEGIPNKIVAHRLEMSVRTAEMHRGNALKKLGVKSIAEVVAITASAGITGPIATRLTDS